MQAYNANNQEERKFHDRVNNVLTLARKEALASAIFFGSTGWSGNVTLLALLGYGEIEPLLTAADLLSIRRLSCFSGSHLCGGLDELIALYCLCWKWLTDVDVGSIFTKYFAVLITSKTFQVHSSYVVPQLPLPSLKTYPSLPSCVVLVLALAFSNS